MYVKPISWSEQMKPSPNVKYDHICGSTPLGDFLITWKGWKDYDPPTIDETPFIDAPFLGVGVDVEDAKRICEEEYQKRIMMCITE